MKRPQTCVFAWLLACIACEFPLSASKYEVNEASEMQVSEPSAESSTEAADDLIAAFAPDDTACADALASACRDEVRKCATTSGCVELAKCMRAQATPAAETQCTDKLTSSIDARWGYETLRKCRAEQHAACSVGNDFRCAGAYAPPSVERSFVTISHTVALLDLDAPEPPRYASNFSVRICSFPFECAPSLAEARTDANGRYTTDVELPTSLRGTGSAFYGYRLLEHASIAPSRVESNVPIWGARTEITRILEKSLQDGFATLVGGRRPNPVFVQMLDCQSDPAADMVFEVASSKAAAIFYTGALDAVATNFTGAGSIYDLETDETHELVVKRLGKPERVLATWKGSQPAGHVVYLRLLPDPR